MTHCKQGRNHYIKFWWNHLSSCVILNLMCPNPNIYSISPEFPYCTRISFLSGPKFQRSDLGFIRKALNLKPPEHPQQQDKVEPCKHWVTSLLRKETAKKGQVYFRGQICPHSLLFTSVMPRWRRTWSLLFYNCSQSVFLASSFHFTYTVSSWEQESC